MQSSKTKDVLKGVLSVVSSWEEKGDGIAFERKKGQEMLFNFLQYVVRKVYNVFSDGKEC
jgi:phage terminase Nu1 subunit (DNA packaging protein)